MGLVKTKLGEEIGALNLGEGKYNMWRRHNRGQQGGGGMLLVKKDTVVDNVIYDETELK